MIDVTLNASMGRQLVTMVIGAMSYQAMMQKKNLDFLKKKQKKLEKQMLKENFGVIYHLI